MQSNLDGILTIRGHKEEKTTVTDQKLSSRITQYCKQNNLKH